MTGDPRSNQWPKVGYHISIEIDPMVSWTIALLLLLTAIWALFTLLPGPAIDAGGLAVAFVGIVTGVLVGRCKR